MQWSTYVSGILQYRLSISIQKYKNLITSKLKTLWSANMIQNKIQDLKCSKIGYFLSEDECIA